MTKSFAALTRRLDWVDTAFVEGETRGMRLASTVQIESLGFFHIAAIAVCRDDQECQMAVDPAHEEELMKWYRAADAPDPLETVRIVAPDGNEREYVVMLFPFCD